jgi:L-cysteine S-thiosulfotransferase
MRFPEVRLVAAVLGMAASLLAHAGPEAAKAEVVSRLRSALPQLAPADYALGGAAVDPDLREQVMANAAAAQPILAEGKRLWTRKFRNGRSLEGCFPNGGRRVAAAYPQFNARLKRVVTLEMAINQCLKSHNEPLYEPADPATMGAVVAYARSLAAGRKLVVRVPPAARPLFEEGRRLHVNRLGQRNFACASCHVQGAGKRFGEEALSPAVGQVLAYPVIRKGSAVTLHARMRECLELMGAAPFPAGSDELNNLEYYLAQLGAGLPVTPNGWRR